MHLLHTGERPKWPHFVESRSKTTRADRSRTQCERKCCSNASNVRRQPREKMHLEA